MNRVLRCIQALGTIKCIPLTCSIGQGGMEEEWNWARRQAWTSHHLWFPKQREFEKRGPHFPVPSGHNSLQPEQLLEIRRRRRKWKRQKRNRLDTRTKQTNKQTNKQNLQVQHTLLAHFFDATAKLRRDIWIWIWFLRIHLQRRSPTFDKVRELEQKGYEDWMNENSLSNRRSLMFEDNLTHH